MTEYLERIKFFICPLSVGRCTVNYETWLEVTSFSIGVIPDAGNWRLGAVPHNCFETNGVLRSRYKFESFAVSSFATRRKFWSLARSSFSIWFSRLGIESSIWLALTEFSDFCSNCSWLGRTSTFLTSNWKYLQLLCCIECSDVLCHNYDHRHASS